MIIIHDMAEARDALTGGASVMVDMITAPGLVARAGIPWMQQLHRQLQDDFPHTRFTLAIDCGVDAARVMEAIDARLGPVYYAGPAARLAKLAAMARQVDIQVLAGPGAS